MFGCSESSSWRIWVSTVMCPLSVRRPTGYINFDESAAHLIPSRQRRSSMPLWVQCGLLQPAVGWMFQDRNRQVTANHERCHASCWVTQGTIHNIQYDRGLTQLLHAELHWLYVADLITYINSAGRFTSVLATKRQTTCLSCARRSPKLQNDSIFILTAATYSSCHGFSAGYIRPSRLYRGRSDNLNNSICKDLRDRDLNIATFRRTI